MEHTKTITAWVQQYSTCLLAHAIKKVDNLHTAQDLVQDTFLSAWKNRYIFKGTASPKTWLFCILNNKIIDCYRRRSGQHLGLYGCLYGENVNEHKLPAMAATPQQQLEKQELIGWTHNLCNRLPDVYKNVISMKYFLELESKEICSRLKLSQANYWVIVHRAKRQLKSRVMCEDNAAQLYE